MRKYNVNASALAEFMGVTPGQIYSWANFKTTPSLKSALKLRAFSGAKVPLINLLHPDDRDLGLSIAEIKARTKL